MAFVGQFIDTLSIKRVSKTGARSSAGSEHEPSKLGVAGSSPAGRATYL